MEVREWTQFGLPVREEKRNRHFQNFFFSAVNINRALPGSPSGYFSDLSHIVHPPQLNHALPFTTTHRRRVLCIFIRFLIFFFAWSKANSCCFRGGAVGLLPVLSLAKWFLRDTRSPRRPTYLERVASSIAFKVSTSTWNWKKKTLSLAANVNIVLHTNILTENHICYWQTSRGLGGRSWYFAQVLISYTLQFSTPVWMGWGPSTWEWKSAFRHNLLWPEWGCFKGQ